jgi:hypothetical protein
MNKNYPSNSKLPSSTVRGTAPDPSIIKNSKKKTLIPTVL